MQFTATLELNGKTATGIEVPSSVVTSLGGGRPAVVVTLRSHSYRTTLGRMGGRYLIPVSAAVREAAEVAAGDVLDVDISLDTAPRTVEVPDDLATALAAAPGASSAWSRLAYSHQKEWVRSICDAKKPETRARRVAAAVDAVIHKG